MLFRRKLGKKGSKRSREQLRRHHAVQARRAKFECLEQRVVLSAYPFQETLVDAAPTAVGRTGSAWDFHMAEWNDDGVRDLIAIRKNNPNEVTKTEVHIFSGKDHGNGRFQRALLHAKSGLHETNSNWSFDIGHWNDDNNDGKITGADVPDLFAIAKDGTSTGKVEVHVFGGGSNFSNHVLAKVTAFDVDPNFDYLVEDWNGKGKPDLVGIKKQSTGTNSTEIHVLAGETNQNGVGPFKKFIEHTGSALHETGGRWRFEMGYYDDFQGRPDLLAIKTSNTGTNSTEVHVLNGSDSYDSFSLHVGTALPETGSDWLFDAVFFNDSLSSGSPSLDLVAINRQGSSATEVSVLSGRETSISAGQQLKLPTTDGATISGTLDVGPGDIAISLEGEGGTGNQVSIPAELIGNTVEIKGPGEAKFEGVSRADTLIVSNSARVSLQDGSQVQSNLQVQEGSKLAVPAGHLAVGADIHLDESSNINVGGTLKSSAVMAENSTVCVRQAGTLAVGDSIDLYGSNLCANGVVMSDVHAQSGSTVEGGGEIGGVLKAAAPAIVEAVRMAAGNSPGVLTTHGLDLQGSNVFVEVEMHGSNVGTDYDQYKVRGTVSLGGSSLDASLGSGFNPSFGEEFVIIDNDGTDAVQGAFNGLSEGEAFDINGKRFHISYRGGDGNDVVLSRNRPPSSQSTFRTINEDGSLGGSLSHSDPDGDGTEVLRVSGPSHASSFSLNPDGTYSYTPQPHFSGKDAFEYRITDGELESSTYTVTVNVDPVADAPTLSVSDAAGRENEWIGLDLATALIDTDESETLTIDISGVPDGAELNDGDDRGGGVWSLAPSDLSSLSIRVPDDAEFDLMVKATSREAANNDTAESTKILSVTVDNIAPTLDAVSLDRPTINEAGGVTLNGSFTDPGSLDTHAVEVDWGDGTTSSSSAGEVIVDVDARTFTASHTYLDDGPNPGAGDPSEDYTIGVSVTDDDGGQTSTTSGSAGMPSPVVTVNNVDPSVNAASDATVDEGTVFSRSGRFTDPGGDTWTATVNYGDGTGEQDLTLNADKTFSLNHVYADDGTYTVTVRVDDDDGGWDEQKFDVEVANVRPTLDPIGDLENIHEGSFIQLPPATFSDPGFDFAPSGTEENFTAAIDWGDGTTEPAAEITLVETAGSEGVLTTGTIQAAHAYADDGTYAVTVSVSDDDGGSHQQSFTVDVLNVAPEVTQFTGSSLNVDDDGNSLAFSGVRGQTLYFDGEFSDPGFDNPDNPASTGGERQETFTYRIEWGDGTYDTAASDWNSGAEGTPTTGQFRGSHVYVEDGTYQITVTVTDDDAGTSEAIVKTATVQVVSMQTGGDLAVGGSEGKDKVQFSRGRGPGGIEVLLDGHSLGQYEPDGRLLAFGQAGNDEIEADGNVTQDAWFYGDAGNDRLKGGAGSDALFGGPGNDRLLGKRGRDLLVGGRGADQLVGQVGDDILIAALTNLDYHNTSPVFDLSSDRALTDREVLRRDHDRSIEAIMAEWTSSGRYADRVSNVRTGGGSLAGTGIQLDGNVVDDGQRDLLTGAAGEDLFFGNPDDDKLTDLKDEAFADLRDWV